MNRDDRRKMEAALRANGFIHVDGMPYTVEQVTLLTWFKLDELTHTVAVLEDDPVTYKQVEELIQDHSDRMVSHLFRAIGLIATLVGLALTIALVQ